MDKNDMTINTVDEDTENSEERLTLSQRFLRAFDKFGDLFMLNIYFFVSCIPIITIGAAFCALYTVTLKMTGNREGRLFNEYFKAFRENLKQGIFIWCIDLLILGLIFFLGRSRSLVIVSGALFFLLSLALPLQFPLLARYKNSSLRIMLNALLLSIAHPGTWFKLYFIWMLPVVVYYFYPRVLIYTWYLWGLILSALLAYICSGFLNRFYEQIESEAPDTKQDNDTHEKDH